VSTNPCPTVAATLSEMNAPTKLSSEASATAWRGPIARVEIDVATTFAVVEAVGEVERERRADDDHEDDVAAHGCERNVKPATGGILMRVEQIGVPMWPR
jgi:hypothetical protein